MLVDYLNNGSLVLLILRARMAYIFVLYNS